MEKLPEIYSNTIENLLIFFNKNAYDPGQQVYFSEIDNEGRRVSGKIYTVALNRLIYGLSYTSQYYNENLRKAGNLANFQLNKLIGRDSIGEYFISSIDGNKADDSENLDIWQQAYGLCGLTELYRNNHDKKLLDRIHSLHDALVKRFRDSINGGFYGNYDISSGQVKESKTLQSLMYPITAYMGNLWLADNANRSKYEPVLKEHLKIIHKVAWNRDTKWVNLKFNDSWVVCKNESEEKPCFTVCPGHNFQLASLFLRTKSWDFLSEEEKQLYNKTGMEILESTFKKNIFANNDTGQGFYSEINPINNKILDTRKTWWQHCEAIVALSMCRDSYSKELEQLKHFFFNNFPDYKNKGEFFYIDKDNLPITSELKGSIGKSTYHTIEMVRFLMENNCY